MNDLEDAIRARFHELAEPELLPRPDLLARVRKARRRQDLTVPGLLVGLGTASALTLVSAGGERPHRDVMVQSTPASPSPSSSPAACLGKTISAQELVREIARFAWPSGARVGAIAPGPDLCVVTVAFVDTPATDADRQAAFDRWGGVVRLIAPLPGAEPTR